MKKLFLLITLLFLLTGCTYNKFVDLKELHKNFDENIEFNKRTSSTIRIKNSKMSTKDLRELIGVKGMEETKQNFHIVKYQLVNKEKVIPMKFYFYEDKLSGIKIMEDLDFSKEFMEFSLKEFGNSRTSIFTKSFNLDFRKFVTPPTEKQYDNTLGQGVILSKNKSRKRKDYLFDVVGQNTSKVKLRFRCTFNGKNQIVDMKTKIKGIPFF